MIIFINSSLTAVIHLPNVWLKSNITYSLSSHGSCLFGVVSEGDAQRAQLSKNNTE